MFKRLTSHSDTMALALLVWLCSLPLLAFMVIPLFGLNAALVTAFVLLLIVLIACHGICRWKLV